MPVHEKERQTPVMVSTFYSCCSPGSGGPATIGLPGCLKPLACVKVLNYIVVLCKHSGELQYCNYYHGA